MQSTMHAAAGLVVVSQEKKVNRVSDVYTKPTKANGGSDEKSGFELPLFGLLKMTTPANFREIAGPSVAQVKENCEKMKAVSEEMADALRQTCSTHAKAATDYGVKVIDISSVNTTAALDFLTNLIDAKSPSEIMNLSVAQARKNFDAASAQSRELWELAQKVTAETAEPIKKGVAGVLQKAG
jgi:phasin